MIAVHFTEVEDFLDELDRHAEDELVLIHRRTVRATPSIRMLPTGLKRVSVVSSFVSVLGRSLDELVHVDAYAGDLWGHTERDAEVEERRDAMMAAIAASCERHGLYLRHGFYEARA